MNKILCLMLLFIFCIPQINAEQLEFDLGIGSSYDLTSTRYFVGLSSDGEAKLTGSDLRYLYSNSQNLSYGLRLASHSGNDKKDLSSGYAYKISISETSPFVKYSIPVNEEGGNTVIEGYFVGGLNFVTMKARHTITTEVSASKIGLMLEGGIYMGIKKDDTIFGGGISLPIETYEESFQWGVDGLPLNYNASIKKNLSVFLIFKTII